MYDFVGIYIVGFLKRNYIVPFSPKSDIMAKKITRELKIINGFCSLFIYKKIDERRNLCIKINFYLIT